MDNFAPHAERVVSVDIGCQPSFAGSGELVMQTESSILVLFQAISSSLSEDELHTELDYALVECVGCNLTRFGYPNDEGVQEHPLYHHGLSEAYGIAEVLNSSWAATLAAQMEASARRIWGDRYEKTYQVAPGGKRHFDWRHFIFTFKENTFECIADELKVLSVGKPFDETIAMANLRIFDE